MMVVVVVVVVVVIVVVVLVAVVVVTVVVVVAVAQSSWSWWWWRRRYKVRNSTLKYAVCSSGNLSGNPRHRASSETRAQPWRQKDHLRS